MISATFLALVIVTVFSTCNAQVQCGKNAALLPCGRRCEDRCNALRPNFCNELKCQDFACRCKDGYYRDPYSNECVNINQCTPDGCAFGESIGFCGTTCEGSCRYPYEPEICKTIFCITSGCRCDLQGGFVRHRITGKCVRIGQCFQ